MLIIPIRQQDSTVRRLPWVSAALIAVNVVVFLLTTVGAGPGRESVKGRVRGLVEYALEHPYLTPSPAIEDLLSLSELLEQARTELDQRDIPSPAVREREQAALDRLSDELLQALARLPTRRFGFVASSPRPEALLTSMFVHVGFLHLLGNMLFLYLSGPFIEDVYGRVLFAVLYLLSGIAAAAAQAVSDPGSTVPMVGASGAVAGLMGAFLVRLTRARVELLVLPLPLLPTLRFTLVLPAFVVLPLWAAEQYWYAQTAPDAGVAWWAHVGGFAFGMAAALAIRLTRVEQTWIHPRIERRISVVQHPGLERAQGARLAGDLPRARREIASALRDEPSSMDALRENLEIAVQGGDLPETGRSATRLLDVLIRCDEGELALELAGDRRLRDLALPARFWLGAASLLERNGDALDALACYDRAVAAAPLDMGALRALVKKGEILARSGNVRDARSTYVRAQTHPACQGSWSSLVEAALKQLAGRG